MKDFSTICSGDIADFLKLQFDWLRAFFRNKIFHKYGICLGTKQTISILIREQIRSNLIT